MRKRDIPEELWPYLLRPRKKHTYPENRKGTGEARHPLDEKRVGNVITKQQFYAIQHYAYNEGLGVLEVARLAGVNKNTAHRYFPRDAICACGRPIVSHRNCKAKAERISPAARKARIAGLDKGRATRSRKCEKD